MALPFAANDIETSSVAKMTLDEALAEITLVEPESDETTTPEEMVTVIVCESCTPVEQQVLLALQAKGIKSVNALSTIMGNIRQESMFISNICEGGARKPYHTCYSGGYGLIQWTTRGRYDGLGRHAKTKGLDPSSIDAQISYLFTEHQWRSVENHFKTPGHSIESYMNSAYRWLGWGIHGRRTTYSYDYARRMTTKDIPMSEFTKVADLVK